MTDAQFLSAGEGKILAWPSKAEVDILHPERNTYRLEDVAHMLGMQNRYIGAVRRFYSVAEHAYLVSHLCDEGEEKEALHHDDSEATMGDCIRPIKVLPQMEWYRELEARHEEWICGQLGIRFPFPPSVKPSDMLAYRIEKYWLKDHGRCPEYVLQNWWTGACSLRMRHKLPGGRSGWSPQKATRMFLRRHYELFGRPRRRFFFHGIDPITPSLGGSY